MKKFKKINKMRTLLFVLILCVYSLQMMGQELKCRVSVISQEIQRSDRQLFRTLQQDIQEFMNTRNWTDHKFNTQERIECRIMINLEKEVSQGEYKGYVQVQSSRPVYNSSYSSPVFVYKDNDLHIEYVENEPLEFNLNSYTSNLTSILAFYAYIIIGMDYDTYSFEGGTEFFQKAETIMNNAQSSNKSGWKAFESSDHKNRYWLITSILDDDFNPTRKFMYQYHRHGLDKMAETLNESRAAMAESLKLLEDVYKRRPDPYMHYMTVIFDAKSNEFIKVFSESPPAEMQRVIRILSQIDPPNASKYKKMKEQQ